MKSKPAKLIYGILVPLLLLVIVLTILGSYWNVLSFSWIFWIIYLLIVFIIEMQLFAPEEKILERIKERTRKIFPLLMKILIVLIILLTVIMAIGFFISSLKIPPEQIEITESQFKNLFIDSEKIGEKRWTP